MATGTPALYADFSGGINTKAGPYVVGETECRDARNISANVLGALQKRNGFTKLSQLKSGSTVLLDGPAHSLFPVNLSTKSLLAVGPYYNNSNDAILKIAASDGAATALKTNATENTRWEFVQASIASANEVQTVTISATGGTFTLTYSGQTTSAINYDATAGTVETALVALSNIDTGDVQVTKAGSVFTITFLGTLAKTNVAELTGNGASLTGGTEPRLTIATTTVGANEGPIYGVNGVDDPVFWDGSSNSTGTWTARGYATHPAKYCTSLIYSQDKIWAAGDTRAGYTGRIYSSGLTPANDGPDPRNWDSDLTLDIEPDDGEVITGLGTIGPYVLVFKNRKTYVIDNPAELTYRVVSSSIGCVAPRSIVETNQGTFFLSEEAGVCVTDGSNITRVSQNIDPTLKTLIADNPSVIQNAAGVLHENSYYLSVPLSQSKNQVLLQYRLDSQSWWIHSCASNQFALLDPVGTPKLYSADPTNLVVQKAFDPDSYVDSTGAADVAYESYWEGPFWTWGEPHINKRLAQYRIDGLGEWQTSTANTFQAPYEDLGYGVTWEQTDASGGAFGGSGTFGPANTDTSLFGPQGGVNQRRYPTPHEGWGRAWSLRITDEAGKLNMEIYAVTAFVRLRTD